MEKPWLIGIDLGGSGARCILVNRSSKAMITASGSWQFSSAPGTFATGFDIDLDEVLKALSEEEDAEEEADKVEELKKEIQETRSVVKFMRAKLNEVNLLNAKLLFSNKLFRAFGLNNNQKLKVVENFDRTKNLREVKLVYATLAESFKKPGNRLSESVKKGSSSKPVRSTKPTKAVLSEGQELRNRFKKLANIIN